MDNRKDMAPRPRLSSANKEGHSWSLSGCVHKIHAVSVSGGPTSLPGPSGARGKMQYLPATLITRQLDRYQPGHHSRAGPLELEPSRCFPISRHQTWAWRHASKHSNGIYIFFFWHCPFKGIYSYRLLGYMLANCTKMDTNSKFSVRVIIWFDIRSMSSVSSQDKTNTNKQLQPSGRQIIEMPAAVTAIGGWRPVGSVS